MPFSFRTGAHDPGSRARRGTLVTAHGTVETPAFMPVGTRASVTGMTQPELVELKAQIILANTYHLLLRPGPDVFRARGGIHGFMGWTGPVLTDSGGFQIFSLENDRVITEEGARFRSYLNQQTLVLSPERSIEVQEAINSDIMMVLDICLASTVSRAEIHAAMERTHRWALRSLAARRSENALFAIVQGGLDPLLRAESARFLTQHPFDGFAIGGLAVGDTRAQRSEVIALAAESLPADKPRYLMGVGTPPDLIEAIGRGVDMFDCIIPTTLAWQGTAFTSTGRVKITRGEYLLSDEPLDIACSCPTCRLYSRGYLHHLLKCKEPLGPRLLSFHNLHHYLDLMRAAREAIDAGTYAEFARRTLAGLDRHEHADGSTKTLVTTRSGAQAVRDEATGEVMHPVIGPLRESDELYARQSGLRERLMAGAVVLFDVGLGAGSNALAARSIAESMPEARLSIVSFERDSGAIELALQNPAGFGLEGEAGIAAAALLRDGVHDSGRTHWRLVRGDAVTALEAWSGALADLVFWDPFSPRSNPDLWSLRAFSALRRCCADRATVYTYSASTTVRTALLLAGFAVGVGDATGAQEHTTCAAVDARDLRQPLGARFLERLSRSSARLPPGAPVDALKRIAALAQFVR